jgi:hypothetical protein
MAVPERLRAEAITTLDLRHFATVRLRAPVRQPPRVPEPGARPHRLVTRTPPDGYLLA